MSDEDKTKADKEALQKAKDIIKKLEKELLYLMIIIRQMITLLIWGFSFWLKRSGKLNEEKGNGVKRGGGH